MDLAIPKLGYRNDGGPFHLMSNYCVNETVCGISYNTAIDWHWKQCFISDMQREHLCPKCFAAFILIPADGIYLPEDDLNARHQFPLTKSLVRAMSVEESYADQITSP